MKSIFLGCGFLFLSTAIAFAENTPDLHRCISKSQFEENAKNHSDEGSVVTATPEQFQFLRGIYALNPNTPPGLPVGDRVSIFYDKNDDTGVAIFVDEDQYCDPMEMPKILVDMLKDIGSGKITHLGDKT